MPITNEADLSRLLAEGRVAAITVDTNIFVEKGLQLNSPVLQAIASLRNRGFSFLLSGTVAQEIRRHLADATETALRAASKAIGIALFEFETDRPTRDALLAQISGGRSALEAAEARFDAYVAATGCELITDAEHVDIATIYDAYFNGEPPFGSRGKKSEFPDALALNALERVAAGRQIAIIVVSKDGDWRSFCQKSPRLHLVADLERALTLINAAPLGLRSALETWLGEEIGREEVRARLEHAIERLEFSVSGYATSGEMEAVAWDSRLIGVEWPAEHETDIIEIKGPEHGTTKVTLSLPLLLKVRVPVELRFSFWDNVDRESVGMGGRTIEVDEELDLRANIDLEVRDPGGENEEIILIDVELEDGQFHEIELGSVDVFEPEDAWSGG
ncbi:hypothetical protein GOC38_22320 [Sinorhizobium meliloti]|nr:hypothetical protein [Sinorhizobium meliloti]MDX0326911.1 hypothetical protein [Sinorhizobium meliloti]